MKKALLLISIVFIGSSCSQRLVDFTIISTKNINLQTATSLERGKSRIVGEDKCHWIIIIPTGIPNMKEAIDKAIESTPGCVALLDGVIISKFWWIPYIYGQQSYVVEGTPLIDPSLVINSETIPTYGMVNVNKDGTLKKVEELTQSDYLALKNNVIKDSKVTKFESSKTFK